MNILNLEEQLTLTSDKTMKNEVSVIINELKREHYPNVINKIIEFRNNHRLHSELAKTLSIVEAVSHTEMEEYKAASSIIRELYEEESTSSKNLLLLGELAFMCDYKLARRILSHAVKEMENGKEDPITMARSYVLLAEAEEKLQKYKRAIKYYKKSLTYFSDGDKIDQYMILYLHFKIGMHYTVLNKAEEAIQFLEKTIVLANAKESLDIKVESLIALAKNYASKEKWDNVFLYGEQALQQLDTSSLNRTVTHAELLTEMAFANFSDEKYDSAIPFYEEAIKIYKEQPHYPSRLLGIICMQYSFCLEKQVDPNKTKATFYYEQAIEYLEKASDRELLENALADVIAYFDRNKEERKKRLYENKFVKLANNEARKA